MLDRGALSGAAERGPPGNPLFRLRLPSAPRRRGGRRETGSTKNRACTVSSGAGGCRRVGAGGADVYRVRSRPLYRRDVYARIGAGMSSEPGKGVYLYYGVASSAGEVCTSVGRCTAALQLRYCDRYPGASV